MSYLLVFVTISLLVTLHELHPSKEALDAARESGVEPGTLETFEQLDAFVATLVAS